MWLLASSAVQFPPVEISFNEQPHPVDEASVHRLQK